MSVQITEKAYGKVVLHAAKYHSQAVGGFLVGSAEGADVRVEDVLPVYHGNPVGPVFEVAWALFEGQAPWAGGRSRVVGLYYAHEELKTPGVEQPVPAFIETLVQAVRERLAKDGQGEPVTLELDGTLINTTDRLCIVPARGGSARTVAPLDSTVAKLNGKVDQLLSAGKQRSLIDVEDHIEFGPNSNVANLEIV